MNKNSATIAVIPARGGSKGVKRKNMQKIGGISLLGRAIVCSLNSGEIDYVLVTTDDTEIQKEAFRYGAEAPFLRPAHLSDDFATTEDAVHHAVMEFEEHKKRKMSIIAVIEPPNPFRRSEKIREAIQFYKTGKYKSVVSVCSLKKKPENIFIKGEFLSRLIRTENIRFRRRQEMEHLCRISGVVYVVGRDDFMNSRKIISDPIGYVNSSEIEAMNIDDEFDLELARMVSKKYNV
ncbi:MAG: acylneuraminate cytidylyltransferase family protein [Desulfobacterales bacterium]